MPSVQPVEDQEDIEVPLNPSPKNSVLTNNPVARILCSVRFVILFIILILVLVMLLVLSLSIAVTFTSVHNLSVKLQSTTSESIQRFIQQSLVAPKAYSHQLLSGSALGVTMKEGSYNNTKSFIFNAFEQLARMDPMYVFALGLYDTRPNSNMMAISGAAGIGFGLFLYRWENVTFPKYTQNTVVQQVFMTTTPGFENNLVEPLMLNPNDDSQSAVQSHLKSYASWGPAFAYNVCLDLPSGRSCAVLIPYIVPVLDGSYFAVNYFTANNLSPTLTSFVSNVKNSDAFIIEMATDTLLACSNSKTTMIREIKGVPTLTKVHEFDRAIVVKTAAELKRVFGDKYQKIEKDNQAPPKIFNYVDNTLGSVFSEVIYFSAGPGNEWLIVHALIRKDFIGKYLTQASVVLAISFVIALLGLFMGLVGAFLISRPFSKIVKQLSYLENMRLDEVSTKNISMFSEIKAIQSTLLTVVSKLREYKAFLPSYVIERDFGNDGSFDDNDSFDENKRTTHEDNATSKNSAIHDSTSDTSTSCGPAKKFALGLDTTQCCIMVCRIANFQSLFDHFTPSEIVSFHGKLLALIELRARRTKGIVTEYNERSFTVYWASNRSSASAVQCALHIIQDKDTFVKALGETLSSNIKIGIGIHSGPIVAGNIGTNAKRQFTVFGESKNIAHALSEYNETTDTEILISEAVQRVLKDSCLVRSAGDIILQESSTPIFNVLGHKYKQQEEWMYEMVGKETQTNQDIYNNAYESYLQGDYQSAENQFREYSDLYPDDKLTLAMLEECQRCIDGKPKRRGARFVSAFIAE